MDKLRKGFTLMEILIVVSIILLLSMAVLMSLRGQTARAMDIRRKTDLYALRKGVEDYYNDRTAFPDQSAVTNCGGSFDPYVTKIPCDPETKKPYGYFLSLSATGGYRLCTKLSDKTDPAIATMGCAGANGCGLGGGYNYCLASGVTASAVGTSDEIAGGGTPTPGGGGGGGGGTPTPTGGGGGGGGGSPTPTPAGASTMPWACTPGTDPITGKGICNWYFDPFGLPPLGGLCPMSWSACPKNNECDTPANRCIY